ncbi:MAG: class I SAM-dependent methyltransferase [Planctomycetes bacterium]|nr:class I SAM-dependent methyltransferase [Planctomycetota bacterium]
MNWLDNSLMDPNGRLFRLDGRLYRAMWLFDEGFYRRLLDTVSNTAVLNTGLVKTRIADLRMTEATTILEHEIIDPLIEPFAWSSRMFYEAALRHCDIHIELAKSGFSLQDAHLWNIAFRHGVPVFMDFGSVTDRTGKRARVGLLREYAGYMIYPLYLMSRGQIGKARRYFHGSNPPLDRRDLMGYFGPRTGLAFLFRSVAESVGAISGLGEMLGAVRSHIAGLTPTPQRSPWDGYHDDESRRAPGEWHAKQRNMHKILSNLMPTSVLDVGCATGWYSALGAQMGCDVIALDTDDEMINRVQRLAAAGDLPITPAVGDIFAPKNPVEGRRVDLVMALGIVHHLVFSQRYDFDRIARVLSQYTRKWLVTEFIDENDSFVKQQPPQRCGSYTIESFVSALGKYFAQIDRYASSSQNRTLLLCGK